MALFQNIKAPYLTVAEGDPDDVPNPDVGHQRVLIDEATNTLKLKNSDGDLAELGGGNHGYYQYLAAMLEPLAVETLKAGAFSYVVGGGETKILTASWNTRLGAAGRMEMRGQRDTLFLRDQTLTGLTANSCAVIVDPALPTYINAQQTYFDRLLEIATSKPQYLGIGASGRVPFLPGPYGAIVLHTTNYNSAWNSIRTNADLYGWALTDEINDTDQFRVTASFHFAVDKKVACEFRNESGSDLGEVRGSSLVYFLCPPTWGVIPDATTYEFHDDFWAASLDTTTKWTRTQSTAGNFDIDQLYRWLKTKGNGNWGDNGCLTQQTFTRVAGKKFVCDVFTGRGTPTGNGLMIGWNDGAGLLHTDWSHGIWIGGADASTRIFKVFENGSDLGAVGSGYTDGTVYRFRITLGTTGATYEVQGGTYGLLGSASWTDITPGSSAASTTPLRVGFSNSLTSDTLYVSDVKVYS